MRISHRLFLTVLPAIVGLLTVSALAYFGEYAREAPEWLVALAVTASLGSGLLAWWNARYVAQRVAQLAVGRDARAGASSALRRATELLGDTLRPGGPEAATNGGADELDRIESLLDRLNDALQGERAARAMREEVLVAREREYTALVHDAVERVLRQLDEVRLPLHILLENKFGELNENQEEMLGAARGAAESADATLLRLRDVVQLDAGTLRLRPERVRLQDVVASVLPPLVSAAEERDVRIQADLSPALPPIHADRGRLQEALAALLGEMVQGMPPGGTLLVVGSCERGVVQLTVRGGGRLGATDAVALAQRVVRAHGGELEIREHELVVQLREYTATVS